MFHFYCYSDKKIIIVSDLAQEIVKKKYGYKFEILTSINDISSLELIKPRIQKSYPGFQITELFKKIKFFSEESRKRISESKKGKPRDPLTRAKISAGLKGRSNFQGKKHTQETKSKMAEKKIGNDHAKDLVWAHNPRGDAETRVKTLKDIPKGFSKGRDYYSTEPGLYYFKQKNLKEN